MSAAEYDPEPPRCDGAGTLPPVPCCSDRGCPCDVYPAECPGCEACEPDPLEAEG